MPALTKRGFNQSPFSTDWFGKDNTGDYCYTFFRLSAESHLEMILVHINKGDRWIQIDLNISRLHPAITDIEQLKNKNGLQFHLSPNRMTLERLVPPRGFLFAGLPQHKIRPYFTKAGLARRIKQLGDLVEKDLQNIDSFVERWMQEHEPLDTDWEGHALNH